MQISFNNKVPVPCPAVMGILNVTPDSFYDGGKYTNEKNILLRAEKILSEGAEIIDIGGVSTRPGSAEISETEELNRLIPAIKIVRKEFAKSVISADTYRNKVAQEAIQAGADMINDISGGTMDKDMFETIGKLNVPYVLTHIQATPSTMQISPSYNDLLGDVLSFFENRIQLAISAGIKQIIIDPGFGFGKTVEQNFILLKNLSRFNVFNLPVLVGLSRKSMITKALNINKKNALNATTSLNTIALINDANILRVHDVREAKEAIHLVKTLSGA